ncbi:MAG: FG-GAP repeat protein [Planctomycetes bacterium]|nr:FG-GAP repeat protein [Planctomycetota bacterium]
MRHRVSTLGLMLAALFSASATAQTVIHSIDGTAQNGTFGRAIAGAGDVDGDGVGDLVVGAVYDSTVAPQAGSATLFSGASGVPLHTWFGANQGANLGRAVDGGGDIDADGVPDLVIGAHEQFGVGSVYALSGATQATLHHFVGIQIVEAYGWAAAHAGDVNGDGYGDVVIGAHNAKLAGWEAGRSAVYSGADGTVLHAWNGIQTSWWEGFAVASAGDVDADGFVDVVSSSPTETTGTYQGGAVRIYSGATGQTLRFATGYAYGDMFGFSVAAAGDVDVDGFDDIVVGAPYDSTVGPEHGAAIVLSGASGFPLATAYGDTAFEHLGWSVDHVGDVDGDGRIDLIAGSPDDYELGPAVRLGSATVFDAGTGQPWFVRRGDSQPALLGTAVAGVGDVDGDGRPDFAIGAPLESSVGTDVGRVTVHSDPFRAIATYGTGNPGVGGITPHLDAFGGLSTPGNASFALLLTQCAGGAAGALVLAPAPASIASNFGSVLIDITQPSIVLSFTVGGGSGQPGAGSLFLPAPIPSGLPLGAKAYLQAFVFDQGATGGIASSAGLSIELAE